MTNTMRAHGAYWDLRHIVCFSCICLAAILAGGWYVPEKKPSIDVLTRKDVALHLAEALPATTSALLRPIDVEPQLVTALNAVLAAGVMNLYPDGTFRPFEPMRIGEVLYAWEKVWKVCKANANQNRLAPSVRIEVAKRASAWNWGIEMLCFLSEIDAESASKVAALSPNDFALRGLWRFLPLPDFAHPMNAKSKIGCVLDAVTQAPIAGAVGTIDGKPFITDINGEFAIPEMQKAEIRDVFVAVNGYRSLSLRWNPSVKADLKLYLRPFFASLEIKTVGVNGKAIKNMPVTVEKIGTIFTDNVGKAVVKALKPGYYNITASSENNIGHTQFIYVPESGTKCTITQAKSLEMH